MTLDDLRVFTAVAEAKSIGAVARQLGCTQPAVSQHTSRLERECGMPLLERSAKGITLTPAGQVFYDASSLGLGALALALREIQRPRDCAGSAGVSFRARRSCQSHPHCRASSHPRRLGNTPVSAVTPSGA
jgi:DNA-binding transcriptional LysR family regulator